MTTEYDSVTARRRELIEIIAGAADELGAIDRRLPVLKSKALEDDLLQAEPAL